MPDAQDQRLKEFQATEKFNAMVLEWLRFVIPRLSEVRDQLEMRLLDRDSGSASP